MNTVIAGIAYFVFVFFKAVQQRNVAFLHYRWVVPVSYLMATTEVIVVSAVAIEATNASSWFEMLPYAFAIGTGGGFGAIAAMWLHSRFIGGLRK